MDIVATIGNTCKGEALNVLVNRLVGLGVNYLRFNMSKNDINADIDARLFEISSIKEKFQVKIMLDLPIPNRKPRLLLVDKEHLLVNENDSIFISFDISSKSDCIYLDSSCEIKPKVGDILYYSDRESEWLVTSVNDEGFSVKIKNSCKIYNAKSICLGNTLKNKDAKSYIDIVNSVKPYSVALSFVNHANEVCDIIKQFNSNVHVISKIETYTAVTNISEIAALTDIMIGRGDLSMYANILKIHKYQNEIVEVASKLKRNIYFATGILTSLSDKNTANVAEIIDLSTIVNYRPTGIILNYGVVKMNIEKAYEIVKDIYRG